eukprot:jgi/Astpho2/5909/Aster-x0709
MVNNHAGTLQALAVSPTVMLGALVKHFAAPQDSMLAASIVEELRVSDEFARELIRFGAVHWCPVPPVIPAEAADNMSAEQLEAAAARRQAVLGRLAKPRGQGSSLITS